MWKKYVCEQIISVCNSERIIKIGQYLQKLCSNEKGSNFYDSQCISNNEMAPLSTVTPVDAHYNQPGRSLYSLFQVYLIQFTHITPILKSLHWLKVNECIEYKLLSHLQSSYNSLT